MAGELKVLKILLEEGSLSGIAKVRMANWSGELLSSPREKSEELLEEEDIHRYGVYLLLSDEKAYVGQSRDLARRLGEHLLGKDWWDRAIVLTRIEGEAFDRSDIDYLESVLIEKAEEAGTLDVDNRNRGNPRKVDEFKKAELDSFLENALFIMSLLGVSALEKGARKGRPLIKGPGHPDEEGLRRRRKGDAVKFLKTRGVHAESRKANYAVLDQAGKAWWLNPRTERLEDDWWLILNDTEEKKVHVLFVPKGSLGKERFFARSDKPYYLDIHIEKGTFVERKSGVDFSPYLFEDVGY